MNKLNPFAAALLFLFVFFISAGPSPGAVEAEKAVQKKVKSFSLTRTLEESIRQLEKLGGVKIRVDWDAIEATGVKRKTKVLLKGSNTKLIEIIELMLVQVMEKGKPLGWFIQDDNLYLTTQVRILRRNVAPVRSIRRSKRPPRARSSARGVQELVFEGTGLASVIETLRHISGVNFFVNWRALETEGINRRTSITFRAKGISTARALDIVMNELNAEKDKFSSIYWVVDGGVVHISTGSVLETTMRTRVVDVADLLFVVPNFVGTRVQISTIGSQQGNSGGTSGSNFGSSFGSNSGSNFGSNSGSNSGGIYGNEGSNDQSSTSEEQSLPELRTRQEEKLINIIKNSIGQDMWEPNGKGSVMLFNKKLVITQSLLGWKLMERSGR
ncbi:MAG TPA: hypothetical protein ENH84_06955 [Phycisphaerae bacterium]|nr:hypothetical protein [Phycisphaerae bacterium]